MKHLKKIIIAIVCVVLLAMPLFACGNLADELAYLRNRLYDLERDLELERDRVAELERDVADLERDLAIDRGDLIAEIALLRQQLDYETARVNNLTIALQQANNRVDELYLELQKAQEIIENLTIEIEYLTQDIPNASSLTIDDFTLSLAPGVYDKEILFRVTHSNPNAVIYWTIDGAYPRLEEPRFLERRGNKIQVSGRVPDNGLMRAADRSGYWKDTMLASHSARWSSVLPVGDILAGTTFRFGAFIKEHQVSQIKTATFIIAEDAATLFSDTPIISVTADYDSFIYIYDHAAWYDTTRRRGQWNYEFFEAVDGEYQRKFSTVGSTQLGGQGSRSFPQRTLNVSFARDGLDYTITHPIFEGLYELRRFRLWNAGNAFLWDHMRDSFTHEATKPLNVPIGDSRVAVKFVNGEFWGFTTIREHTNNTEYGLTRLGIPKQNRISVMNGTWTIVNGLHVFYNEISEGGTNWTTNAYNDLTNFVANNDLSLDEHREVFFNDWWCMDNFIDYFISKTFFDDIDWPHNNLRFFRARDVDTSIGAHPNLDGRWRFILHDSDHSALRPVHYSIFHRLYNSLNYYGTNVACFNRHVFQVFNNLYFVEAFVARALHVAEEYFNVKILTQMHTDFTARIYPLLDMHYNRFPIHGSPSASHASFAYHNAQLLNFVTHRHSHYKNQLNHLIDRLT